MQLIGHLAFEVNTKKARFSIGPSSLAHSQSYDKNESNSPFLLNDCRHIWIGRMTIEDYT